MKIPLPNQKRVTDMMDIMPEGTQPEQVMADIAALVLASVMVIAREDPDNAMKGLIILTRHCYKALLLMGAKQPPPQPEPEPEESTSVH